MGNAGGESSMLFLGRSNIQNGLDDEAVGCDNEQEASKGLQDHRDKPSDLQC